MTKLYADADINSFGIPGLRTFLEAAGDKEPGSYVSGFGGVTLSAAGNYDFWRTEGKSGTEAAVSCVKTVGNY